MTNQTDIIKVGRARWAAFGAAVAVSLGVGGVGLVRATSPEGASTYIATNPCRLFDTRSGDQNVGERATPLGENESWNVEGRGEQGDCVGAAAIPAEATALQLNVTALGATQATFLQLYPGGAERPTSSNLNPEPGQPPVPNSVTVALGADGTFNIFNRFGALGVIADVVGYYTDHNHDDRYYTKDEADYANGELVANINGLSTSVDQELSTRPSTPGGTIAYAWMCDPDSDVLDLGEACPGFAWNDSGSVQVDRTGNGRYRLTFVGLDLPARRGNVQVTPFGPNPRICTVRSWGDSDVNVSCFDLAGTEVDSQFTVLVTD